MSTDTTTNPTYRFPLLVKYFTKKEHADAFQDGLLYARRLNYFRREEEDRLRGDVDEGGILLNAAKMELSVDGKEWVSLTPDGPIRFNYPILDNLNLFCMTMFLSSPDHGPTQRTLDEVVAQAKDSLDVCMDMGTHAVSVAQPEEFFDRVEKAVNSHGYGFSRNPVEYYDTYPVDASRLVAGSSIKWRHAFLKSRRYEKQREYRFAFNTNTRGDDPLELQVGSLRDITMCCHPRVLADASSWRFRP